MIKWVIGKALFQFIEFHHVRLKKKRKQFVLFVSEDIFCEK